MHAYHLRPRQTNHCSCLGYLAWLDAQDVHTTFFSLKEVQEMRNATTAREKLPTIGLWRISLRGRKNSVSEIKVSCDGQEQYYNDQR